MRALLITPFYAPDLGPSAPLFTLLCEELVKSGYKVSVICAVPHYPSGAVSREFRGKLFQREIRRGVKVTRVWVPSLNRKCLWQRLLIFIFYQILATFAGLRHRYDALIVTNPAIETGLPFLALGVLRRKPVIFSVHDIYPDVGIKLGIFRHSLVVGLVRFIEHFCLKYAVYVRVLSDSFIKNLKAKGVPESKLVLIWDWVDTDLIRPISGINNFSKQWGIENCFVVMYAGNIGFSQNLEYVVEAAKLLSKEQDIRFVFVGDGAARGSLQKTASLSGLTNIRFIPFQPRELLPLVLASADISLISLKPDISADSVPSKFYSILSSGRPAVACVDRGSDTWSLINRARCGVCVEPRDYRALAAVILQLYYDRKKLIEFGNNGRNYVVKNHSHIIAAEKFQDILQCLIR